MLSSVSVPFIFILLFIGMFLPNTSAAERFSVYRYGSTDKKASSLVKTAIEDSFGTLWFGGDGGLTRHNGYKYTSFTKELPSQFVKSLHRLNDGTLVCLTDLGICGITVTSVNSAKVDIWHESSTSEVEGKLFYPKNLYVDKNGFFWIAEPNAIVRLRRTNNGLEFIRRFQLPLKVRTQSFSRSFQFWETPDGHLFTFSETGYIFRYSPESDTWTEWSISGAVISGLSGIATESPFRSTPLIASSIGLFQVETIDSFKRQISIKKINNVTGISDIAVNDSVVFLGTWEKGAFIGTINNLRNINELESPVINDIYIGNSVTWIAADDGVFAVKSPLFISHPLRNRYYIEAISQQPNGNLIISDGRVLYQIQQQGKEYSQPKQIYTIENDLLLSLTSNDSIIYAGSRECAVISITSDNKHKITQLPSKGNRLLNSISLDNNANLWACEDKVQGLHRISQKGDYYFYNTLPSSVIHCVYKNPHGVILAGGEFPGLLFTYSHSSDSLTPLQISNTKDIPQNLIVYSLLSSHKTDTLYLGTNMGIWSYVYKTNTISAVQCSDFGNDNFTVWALHYTANHVMWASTTLGPLAYTKNQATFFTEEDGLRTTAMAQCKIVGGTSQFPLLWLGSASGLHSINTKEILIKQSSVPIIYSLTSAGKNILTNNISYGSYFKASYFANLFPEDAIEYRTRISNNPAWSVPSNSTEFMLSSLPKGEYILEIQVRQRGKLWSNSATYSFTVSSPWYLQWYIILPFSAILALFGYLATSRNEALEARRGAEKEARVRQSYFIAIIDSSEDIIWSLDLDYNFTAFNISAYNYVQERYGVQLISGEHFFDIIPDTNHATWKLIFENTLQNGIQHFSFRETTREIYYETIVTPIFSEDKTIGIAINARDVTTSRLREKEIEKARNEAEAAYKSQSAFLSLMSHEIRTPLNAVLGFSSILLQQERSPEERMFIEQIHSNGNYLLEVMNNILDISRLESGHTKVQSQPFSIHEILDNVIRKFKDHCAQKGLFLHLTISDNLEKIALGDSKLIRQVLVQLVDNALKFTNSGGITLKASSELCSEDNKIQYIVEIIDTGIGISDDKLDVIFNPFSQAEDSSTRQFGGAGIGLSICKKIAEIIHGSIIVTSTQGVGSTFSFSFECDKMEVISLDTALLDIQPPLTKHVPHQDVEQPRVSPPLASDNSVKKIEPIEEPATPTQLNTTEYNKQANNRVLVAEDNPIIGRKMLSLLHSLHYSADLAESAVKAKELITTNNYSICFIDNTLPDSTDTELAQYIVKSSLSQPKLVSLHMSDEQKVPSELFSASLIKPVDRNLLQEILLRFHS